MSCRLRPFIVQSMNTSHWDFVLNLRESILNEVVVIFLLCHAQLAYENKPWHLICLLLQHNGTPLWLVTYLLFHHIDRVNISPALQLFGLKLCWWYKWINLLTFCVKESCYAGVWNYFPEKKFQYFLFLSVFQLCGLCRSFFCLCLKAVFPHVVHLSCMYLYAVFFFKCVPKLWASNESKKHLKL